MTKLAWDYPLSRKVGTARRSIKTFLFPVSLKCEKKDHEKNKKVQQLRTKEASLRSNPVFGLQHDDGVASDDHHADGRALSGLGELDGLVQDEVHEGVEASEDALDRSATVDLQMDLEFGDKLVRMWIKF